MKNFALTVILFISASQALACSDLGKQEFKLDSKVGTACGALAQELALKIGNITFPSLKKGESAEPAPHSPFQARGLEPHAKLQTKPSETLEKRNGSERTATFPTTISTKQGNWECLYCITFEVGHDKCVFKQAQIDHCAGGVSYP